ncbi:hypothetical protein ACT6NV_00570 [Robiginitalea sp. IMCC44478]|uniref:hypothetical protein n=1 Tax=Robiginitalea sp. IMCC44478 TaxID=3459122 RepID=UPI0040420643
MKNLLLCALLCLGLACADKKDEPIDYEALYLPEMEQLFERYNKLESSGSYLALAQILQDANRDLQASELYVQAAYMYQEAGITDSVVLQLQRAIDHGMSNPKILDKFPGQPMDLRAEDYPELARRLDSIAGALGSVSNFSLETGAMNAFWPYFEKALADTSQARKLLREFIFTGPRELRDFYVVRYGSIDLMYGQMINAAPNYYRYLKTQFDPDSLALAKEKAADWMQNFKGIYPEAVFPKIYIVPGILNSGGTATEMGMFIGGDMYGRSEKMPVEELTEWQQNAIMNFKDLPGLTIHELMHFQQNYGDTENAENVLGAVIQEGVCDFLVEIASGEPLQHPNLVFLSEPENHRWIFGELRADLLQDDYSKWLYNGENVNDRPHDLGYSVGYLISKSYYELHPDKKEAVYQLLNTSDFTEIVRQSTYKWLLEPEIF